MLTLYCFALSQFLCCRQATSTRSTPRRIWAKSCKTWYGTRVRVCVLLHARLSSALTPLVVRCGAVGRQSLGPVRARVPLAWIQPLQQLWHSSLWLPTKEEDLRRVPIVRRGDPGRSGALLLHFRTTLQHIFPQLTVPRFPLSS
jgi:hypothetical protein